jgi:hypothetical protein
MKPTYSCGVLIGTLPSLPQRGPCEVMYVAECDFRITVSSGLSATPFTLVDSILMAHDAG